MPEAERPSQYWIDSLKLNRPKWFNDVGTAGFWCASGIVSPPAIAQQSPVVQAQWQVELLFEIPGLPSADLSANARVHWAQRAKAFKQQKIATEFAIHAARIHPMKWKVANVQATVYVPDRRRRDADNYLGRLKPSYDALQSMGIVEDDSGLIHHPLQFVVDKERQRVQLKIWTTL
jgi:Holliday junction resolvase RusA-like endonuclease